MVSYAKSEESLNPRPLTLILNTTPLFPHTHTHTQGTRTLWWCHMLRVRSPRTSRRPSCSWPMSRKRAPSKILRYTLRKALHVLYLDSTCTRPLISAIFFFGLKEIFAEYGQIEEVHIMRDKVR